MRLLKQDFPTRELTPELREDAIKTLDNILMDNYCTSRGNKLFKTGVILTRDAAKEALFILKNYVYADHEIPETLGLVYDKLIRKLLVKDHKLAEVTQTSMLDALHYFETGRRRYFAGCPIINDIPIDPENIEHAKIVLRRIWDMKMGFVECEGETIGDIYQQVEL